MGKTKVKDKIYTHQAIFLITIYRSMTPLTYAPLLKSSFANQDTWFMILLSIPYTILYCLPLLYLSNKFMGMDLLEYTETITGKFVGRILETIYGIIFLLYLTFFTTSFIEILNSALYPNTPPWVNLSILIVTVIYIVSKGAMNIARLSEILFPILFFTFFMLLILGFEDYNFQYFFPILRDSTFKQLSLGAMLNSVYYIDILILVMLTSHLEKKKDLNKVFIHSLLYTAITTLFASVAIQATLGIAYAKYINFPFYNYARLIRIGDTMGFDLLYIITWMIGFIFRISGYFYITTVTFGKLFNVDERKTYIPITIIMIVVALYVQGKTTIVTEKIISPLFVIGVGSVGIILIPVILLITYFFRRKSIKSENTGSSKRN